ncbi:MAG: LLM class flavin-dependent oxidoreductase [Chloroflexi bacterium]|nr:LLM class flavin-dependent oxidoreductase [Chloroflexota bacterium]
MVTTRFSYHLHGGSGQELVAVAKRCESLGFDTLWSQQLYSTPFVPLAAVATHVRRVRLGSGIALAFVRSPLETALSALDMDAATDGRFILGLGTGVQRLNERWHGVQNYGRPAPHLKECAQAVRLIIEKAHTGQPLRFKGQYYDIDIVGYQRPWKPVRPTIPIYVAAIREGMCRVAGEVGDGLIGHTLSSPKWLREVIQPNARIGLARSGRDPSRFQIVPALCVAVSGDRKEARRDAAGVVSFYASVRTYEPYLAFHGFQEEAQRVQEAFRRNSGFGPAVTDCVTEEMVDTFTAAGTVDEVRDKVRRYEGLADHVVVAEPGYFISEEKRHAYRDALFGLLGR